MFERRKPIKSIAIITMFLLIMSVFVLPDETYAASKIHLKKTSVSVTIGSSYQQKLINKSGKTIKATSVKWKSGKTSVAKVSKTGKITTVKVGTAKMTAKYKGKTYKFTVYVKNPTLNASKKTLKCGDKYTVKLLNTSKKAISTSNITYSSDNTDVATISSKGVVTAKKIGTAIISLKYKGKTFKSTITVKSRLTFDKTSCTFDNLNSQKVLISADSHVTSISWALEQKGVVTCKWGEWNNNKIYLTITPQNAGSARIKITYEGKGSSYEERYIDVKVNVEQYGSVSGNVTYYYNKYQGHKPDTNTTVLLIPKDGTASSMPELSSYVDWNGNLIKYDGEDYKIYGTKVDGMGEYALQDIPTGEYLLFMISSKTTSGEAFADRDAYINTISNIVSPYVNATNANYLGQFAGYNKYYFGTVTIKNNQDTIFSHDFGITYI